MHAQVSAALPNTRSDTAPFVICHMQAQTQMILVICHIHAQKHMTRRQSLFCSQGLLPSTGNSSCISLECSASMHGLTSSLSVPHPTQHPTICNNKKLHHILSQSAALLEPGCISDAHDLQSLVHQLEEAAKQARQQARNLQEAIPTSPHSALPSTAPEATAETGPGKGPSARGNVPGLQDLKGSWSGAFQAYGGGGGAANTDFDVKGADWQWGNYRMDQVR